MHMYVIIWPLCQCLVGVPIKCYSTSLFSSLCPSSVSSVTWENIQLFSSKCQRRERADGKTFVLLSELRAFRQKKKRKTIVAIQWHCPDCFPTDLCMTQTGGILICLVWINVYMEPWFPAMYSQSANYAPCKVLSQNATKNNNKKKEKKNMCKVEKWWKADIQ